VAAAALSAGDQVASFVAGERKRRGENHYLDRMIHRRILTNASQVSIHPLPRNGWLLGTAHERSNSVKGVNSIFVTLAFLKATMTFSTTTVCVVPSGKKMSLPSHESGSKYIPTQAS
jgi:hypothetical protein